MGQHMSSATGFRQMQFIHDFPLHRFLRIFHEHANTIIVHLQILLVGLGRRSLVQHTTNLVYNNQIPFLCSVKAILTLVLANEKVSIDRVRIQLVVCGR